MHQFENERFIIASDPDKWNQSQRPMATMIQLFFLRVVLRAADDKDHAGIISSALLVLLVLLTTSATSTNTSVVSDCRVMAPSGVGGAAVDQYPE